MRRLRSNSVCFSSVEPRLRGNGKRNRQKWKPLDLPGERLRLGFQSARTNPRRSFDPETKTHFCCSPVAAAPPCRKASFPFKDLSCSAVVKFHHVLFFPSPLFMRRAMGERLDQRRVCSSLIGSRPQSLFLFFVTARGVITERWPVVYHSSVMPG